MDDGEFRRVAGALRRFHKRFAPLFGRKEAQRHGEQYVRGLLTTREERRNAENLAEAVVGTESRAVRALQQFLTDSPWRHEAVLAELQRVVAEQLLPQEAGEGIAADGVFTLDSTGFAKRGRRSAGVARQYSGTLGKVDNCQIGVFLGYATTRGHALIDGRLWLPREWTDDPERCRRAGIPEDVLAPGYQSQADLGLALLQRARATEALVGCWVTADEAFGQVPTLRDALDAEGWWYVAEVPCTTPVFTAAARTRQVRLTRTGPPRPVEVQPAALTVQDAAAALPAGRWTIVTVAEGAQGTRRHRFAARRVRESRDGLPGRACWLVLRRDLDGSEPKFYLSNAPEGTSLVELARVGATRWTVETEFQTSSRPAKGWSAWTSTRSAAGRAGTITSHCACWPTPSCSPSSAPGRGWGEKDAAAAPTSHGPPAPPTSLLPVTRSQVARILRAILPRRRWRDADLRAWLAETQRRNACATASHTKRRQQRLHELSL